MKIKNINNLKIFGNEKSTIIGNLSLYNSKNIEFNKVIIHGNNYGGIHLWKVENLKIHNSLLKNMKHRFIDISNSRNIVIKKVTFDTLSRGHFIEISGKSIAHIDNCIAKNNHFGDEVIKIDKKAFITIANSKFINNKGSNFSKNARFSRLINNTFDNNPELDNKLTAYQMKNEKRNILHYNRILSVWRQYSHPLYKRNGKWKSINDFYKQEFDVIVDFRNGYIEIFDEGGMGHSIEQFALFKNSAGKILLQ